MDREKALKSSLVVMGIYTIIGGVAYSFGNKTNAIYCEEGNKVTIICEKKDNDNNLSDFLLPKFGAHVVVNSTSSTAAISMGFLN